MDFVTSHNLCIYFIIKMFEIIFYGVKLMLWRGGITYILEVSRIPESTNSQLRNRAL